MKAIVKDLLTGDEQVYEGVERIEKDNNVILFKCNIGNVFVFTLIDAVTFEGEDNVNDCICKRQKHRNN